MSLVTNDDVPSAYEEIFFDPDTGISYPLLITVELSKQMQTDVLLAEKLFDQAKKNYMDLLRREEVYGNAFVCDESMDLHCEDIDVGNSSHDMSLFYGESDASSQGITNGNEPLFPVQRKLLENKTAQNITYPPQNVDQSSLLSSEPKAFYKNSFSKAQRDTRDKSHQKELPASLTGGEMLLINRGQRLIWTYQGTMQLINSYATHIHSGSTIAQKFNIISEELTAFKYEVSGLECQRKWGSLMKTYRTLKNPTTGVGKQSTFLFYNAIDEIVGHTPSNSSPHTLSSMAKTPNENNACVFNFRKRTEEVQKIPETIVISQGEERNDIAPVKLHDSACNIQETFPQSKDNKGGDIPEIKLYDSSFHFKKRKRSKNAVKDQEALQRIELLHKKSQLDNKKIIVEEKKYDLLIEETKNKENKEKNRFELDQEKLRLEQKKFEFYMSEKLKKEQQEEQKLHLETRKVELEMAKIEERKKQRELEEMKLLFVQKNYQPKF